MSIVVRPIVVISRISETLGVSFWPRGAPGNAVLCGREESRNCLVGGISRFTARRRLCDYLAGGRKLGRVC